VLGATRALDAREQGALAHSLSQQGANVRVGPNAALYTVSPEQPTEVAEGSESPSGRFVLESVEDVSTTPMEEPTAPGVFDSTLAELDSAVQRATIGLLLLLAAAAGIALYLWRRKGAS
jgi:hypothetical protein